MDATDDSQWQFQPSHFKLTPSRTFDNLTPVQELKDRSDGVHFMLRCGNALKLKSNVLSCAAMYFHRFYMRYSIGPNGYDKKYTAITCLFIASKVEESTRKLKDVAHICYLKLTGDNSFKEADKWQDRVQNFEPIVLETLCFDLLVCHPHECLAEAFNGANRDAAKSNWTGTLYHPAMVYRGLYQLSWSVLNDSLRTPLCLFYGRNLIACAAYLIAFTAINAQDADAVTPNDHPDMASDLLSRTASASETAKGSHVDTRSAPELVSTEDTTMDEDNQAGEIITPGTEDPRSKPLPLDVTALYRGNSAGPWPKAFMIRDSDIKDLIDIIGNLLELYRAPPGEQMANGITQVVLTSKYESLTGLSPAIGSTSTLTTSNSSPALTLASNATPVHGARDENSQDFSAATLRGSNADGPDDN